MQKMFHIGLAPLATKEIQHPQPWTGLWWPLLSLSLFGAALELGMFPGSVVPKASLDSANMDTTAFSIASLRVVCKANVTAIWSL